VANNLNISNVRLRAAFIVIDPELFPWNVSAINSEVIGADVIAPLLLLEISCLMEANAVKANKFLFFEFKTRKN